MSNIFEEMRADRAQRAEIRRADRAAEREQDRTDRQERQQRANQRRAARRERRTAKLRWLSSHPVELLMAVIVVVPALLAWTAMAVYGQQLYGPLGVMLPLFTEAAMWAFAFKLHTARRHERPTGWLLVGTWTFTAVAAVLNFIHGYSQGGWTVGVVMAVVSTGGVIAHQIITAAPLRPRRTRDQRRAARTQRIADRRMVRIQRAAVRCAVGELTADGTVRLLHRPGTVTLRRRASNPLRPRLSYVNKTIDDPTAVEASVADSLSDEVEQWLRETPLPDPSPSPRPVSEDTTSELHRDRPGDPPPEPGVAKPIEPSRRSMQQLRAELRDAVADGRVDPTSAESIRKTLRVGRDRAQRLRDEWNDGTAGVPA